MAKDTLEGVECRHPSHRRFRAGGTHRATQSSGRSRRYDQDRIAQTSTRTGLESHGLGHTVAGRSEGSIRPSPEDFDALLLPGGVINPDSLRIQPECGRLCEGVLRCRKTGCSDLPWPLDRDRDRRGAWAAHDVMALAQNRPQERRSGLGRPGSGRGQWGLVTSRSPDDIPAFNRETIKLFSGARGRRHAA